ncbi:MAG: alkaline phosphatase family protein [Nocardioides sp.]|uniref:alkaline phosphatase family protein n=1 Tax=Nocardioides sp. TaxID=35761 RepID=UPI0039E580E0
MSAPANAPLSADPARISASRRTVLKAGAAGLVVSAAAGAVGTSAADAAVTTSKRCVVLVLDGCRPEELDLGITPNITALRDGGIRYPRALSQPIMETIPNHMMMMTGVRPDQNGIPANTVYDRTVAATRDATWSDFAAARTAYGSDTLLHHLRGAGLTTGSVLSKTYLYNAFLGEATYQWEPTLALPITGHEVDALTVPAAIQMMTEQDPHLLFVNLGDIDRFGHADIVGGLTTGLLGNQSLPVVRRTALADTDAQVGRLVTALKSAGHWDDTLLLVLADHCMDWSAVGSVVSLTSVFDADTSLAGSYEIACNGGADLVYWTGSAAGRTAGLARMRELALATTGVLSVHDPADLGLGAGALAGDLVAFCRKGYRFSDPTLVSNPIPGNHGHPTTRPIPFFLAGGAVTSPSVRSHLVATYDVAPTVGAFFGVAAPASGWVGTSRP